jgi:peptidyl-prolyl cis-trans isomerase C
MKKISGRFFLILAAIVGLASISIVLPLSASEQKAPDTKVARVNKTVITQADFDKEMTVIQSRLAAMGRPINDEQMQSLKMKILDGLISMELLFQESERTGIKIEDAAAKQEIDQIKKRFPDEKEFKTFLTHMKLSESELSSRIKRELAINKLIDTQIAPKISISEEATKAYYDEHPQSFNQPAQVKASHILIKVDAKADEAQKTAAHKKIEGIQARLKKGEDFAALAKENSQCPSNAQGGDLGFFEKGRMAKSFEDAAFSLETGKVSDIVETPFGYHLIKVTDKKSESTAPYAEAKPQIQDFLKQQEVKNQVTTYTEDLKKKAEIEILMAEKPSPPPSGDSAK